MREFGQPLEEPQLPAVIAAIEDCGKPVVAALHGAALGGGFELALGCDARVASPGTAVGLPEVTLGIIPGAGGTQRLPRIVGVPRAIRMVCSGERVKSDAALSLGLVDELATGDLRATAIAHARRLNGAKSLLRDRAVPTATENDICRRGKRSTAGREKTPRGVGGHRGRPIVGNHCPSTKHWPRSVASSRCCVSRARPRALRHQFFAERDAPSSRRWPACRPARFSA